MIEDVKITELEEETSTVPVDDLIVETQDIQPKETPDYSLTFPETAELLEEPKHFGRLAMWRKLRQLSGTLINALERLEGWTEYLFGVNGKFVNLTYSNLDVAIEISDNNLKQGHRAIYRSYTTALNINSIYIPLSTFSSIPEQTVIEYISFRQLNTVNNNVEITIGLHNNSDVSNSYTIPIKLSLVNK